MGYGPGAVYLAFLSYSGEKENWYRQALYVVFGVLAY
jgi:hypothetical protein